MAGKEDFLSNFRINPKENTHIGKIYAIVSGKGGVGKSLVTSLIALGLRRDGYEVGILDADITGPSIPQIFGLNGETLLAGDEGIYPSVTNTGIKVVSSNLILEDPTSPIIWRSPMITSLIKQFYTEVIWGDLDYMLIDLPPGTGDVPLTIFQSLPLDGIIVVTTPQDLVSLIVEKSINMAEQMEIPVVGMVQNMSYVVCDNCGNRINLFGDTSNLEEKMNIETIVKLPLDPKISQSCDNGTFEQLYLPEMDELIKKL